MPEYTDKVNKTFIFLCFSMFFCLAFCLYPFYFILELEAVLFFEEYWLVATVFSGIAVSIINFMMSENFNSSRQLNLNKGLMFSCLCISILDLFTNNFLGVYFGSTLLILTSLNIYLLYRKTKEDTQ